MQTKEHQGEHTSASSLAQFCVPPMQWIGDLERLRPEDSQSWNTVVLTKGDLDENFFALMKKLFCVYKEGKLDKACFAKLHLNYSLPCSDGREYELIPSGSQINVTADNASDFFDRLHHEHAKLRRLARLSSSVPMNKGGKNNLPVQACLACQEMEGDDDGCASGRERSSHPDTREGRDNSPCTNLENSDNIKEVHEEVLTDADLSFLNDFYDNARAMLKSLDINNGELPYPNLRWCIIIPSRNLSIPLRSHGDSIIVSSNAFHEYLESALQVIQEIRRVIAAHGCYPAPPGHSSSQPNTLNPTPADNTLPRDRAEILRSTRLREVAIPRQLTSAEAALYSPTHNFTGLFAPPQHLNV